jgi:hypothetical protein
MNDSPAERLPNASTNGAPASVSGERPCTQCGYSLLGQSIVRDPHYGMLIVRCPECAAVTSVLDYPRLARWSRVLGALALAVWIMCLLGATVVSMWILIGTTMITVESSGNDYAYHLNNLHQAAVDAELAEAQAKKAANGTDDAGDASEATVADDDIAEAVDAAVNVPGAAVVNGTVILPDGRMIMQGATTPPGITVPSADFDVWWSNQDAAAVLTDAGGWTAQFDRRALLMLLPLTIAVFAVGCFWSVALTFAKWRWLFGWIAVLAGILLLVVTIVWWDYHTQDQFWDFRVARAEIGRRVIWLIYLYALVPLIAGALTGRMLARLLVRALLPPAWRAPLAFLWTRAGKPAPIRVD